MMFVRPHYMNALKTYPDVPLAEILAGIRRCDKSSVLDDDDMITTGSFHRIHGIWNAACHLIQKSLTVSCSQ